MAHIYQLIIIDSGIQPWGIVKNIAINGIRHTAGTNDVNQAEAIAEGSGTYLCHAAGDVDAGNVGKLI